MFPSAIRWRRTSTSSFVCRDDSEVWREPVYKGHMLHQAEGYLWVLRRYNKAIGALERFQTALSVEHFILS